MNFPSVKILLVTIAADGFLFTANAQNQSDSKIDCVNGLIDFCASIIFPDSSNEQSTFETTQMTDSGENLHIMCITNYNGTMCTQNGSPILYCSPDKNVTYKGTVLQENSANGADNDTCSLESSLNPDSTGLQNIFSSNVENLGPPMNDLFSRMFPFGNTFFDPQENLMNNFDEQRHGLDSSLNSDYPGLQNTFSNNVNDVGSQMTGLYDMMFPDGNNLFNTRESLMNDINEQYFPFRRVGFFV